MWGSQKARITTINIHLQAGNEIKRQRQKRKREDIRDEFEKKAKINEQSKRESMRE